MKLRTTLAPALILLAALGCAKTTGAGPSERPSAGHGPLAAASPQTAPAREPSASDIAPYFKPYPAGAFVVYDLKRKRHLRHDEARCRVRFPPFSTFKIPNSLIGLETGVIADAEFAMKWDEKKYPAHSRDTLPFSSWWQDQTLRTAFRRSALWYYRELALRVGHERMKEHVRRLRYGNSDASGPVDRFWLGNSLQISADEQVEFLTRLYRGELPVSKRSLAIVREIMTLEEMPAYRLSGKTGGGALGEGRYLGWFVGHLETKEGAYVFATQIEGPTYLSIRDERIAVTKRILAGLGYMKE
jgi:beta-lactamase class D